MSVRILIIVMMMMSGVCSAAAPEILASSAIMIESTTGRVIYEKNADERRAPASMTKMMTCILGLEQLPSSQEVLITPEAASAEDNTFKWRAGERIRADELLMGMMTVSDNGAAIAIAQAIRGSVRGFAELMNEKAQELGCTDTHFANPNGLPNNNHYSTARDMARIAYYGMSDRRFREIVATKKDIMNWSAPADKWEEAENTNELLYLTDGKYGYKGANGIKTGWTSAAGGCLAASAQRGDTELIVIIMNSPDVYTRFEDARKLLDYGFSQVKMTKGLNRERVEKVVFVKGGKDWIVHAAPAADLRFPLLEGESMKLLKVSYELPKIVEARVDKGKVLGNAKLKYNGEVVAQVAMVAAERVEKGFSVKSLMVNVLQYFV